jgi:hypothetical protein
VSFRESQVFLRKCSFAVLDRKKWTNYKIMAYSADDPPVAPFRTTREVDT